MSLQPQAKVAPRQAPFTPLPTPALRLQRRCACGGMPGPDGECAACRNKRLALQRLATTEAGPDPVPPLVHDVLRAPGQALDADTRAFVEPRFGHDFSRVRIHADTRAAEAAESVNALAYTVGQDVVFGAGQYVPGTQEGWRLLAHELTHVLQQGGSPGAPQAKLTISTPGDADEREADRVADEVSRDSAAGVDQVQPVDEVARAVQRTGRPDRLQRFVSCGTAGQCPAREPGELDRARTGPLVVDGVTGPVRVLLVSNFNSGSARLKGALTSNRNWGPFWGEMVTHPNRRWEILGFSDCHGESGSNELLRWERAIAVNNALPLQARQQVERFAAAPPDDCMVENGTASGRAFNRSALIMLSSESLEFPPETVTGRRPSAACFDGATIVANKGSRSHSCPALTGNVGAPTPPGRYCIRRQGEAQVGGGLRGLLFQNRSKWYLLEPQFPTARSRMQLHPGTFSEGCITVTDGGCFDELAAVLNGPGSVQGTGYDGYPPGNAEGVTNPEQRVSCVGWLDVRSGAGSCSE